MIYIVDRFVEGYLHVLANVNTIKILNLVYPDQAKVFVAEESHVQLVKSYFNEKPTDFTFSSYKNFKLSKPNNFTQAIRVLNRSLKDIVYFIKLFRSVKREPGSFVFVTHIYPLSLVFLKFIKGMYPDVRIIVTIHGEIEYLFFGKGSYEKIIGKLYQTVFRMHAANFYYLFLTKVSRGILIDSGNLTDNEIIVAILPTLSSYLPKTIHEQVDPTLIKIGHIGSAGKRKNADLLYNMADKFKTEIENKKITFSIIGPIEENLLPYLNPFVKNFVQNKANVHLERAIFNLEAEQINYAVFFYGPHDFVLRSSAAFFDVIYFEKPMIVLKNDFFENVFHEAGEIGYICGDLEEMGILLKRIIRNDNSVIKERRRHLENIRNYKKSLELNNIADEISSQLKNLKFDQT